MFTRYSRQIIICDLSPLFFDSINKTDVSNAICKNKKRGFKKNIFFQYFVFKKE